MRWAAGGTPAPVKRGRWVRGTRPGGEGYGAPVRDTRQGLLVIGFGLLLAVLGAAMYGPRSAPMWLGGVVAVIGFVMWQVAARRRPTEPGTHEGAPPTREG